MKENKLQKTSILKNLPIFQGLTDKELAVITKIIKPMTFEYGEIVISEGEKGDSLFIVMDGSVEVLRESGDSDNISLGILTEGAYFGELSLFDDYLRSATVKALEYTLFFTITRKDFTTIFEKHQRIKNIIYKNTISETFSRFREVSENFTFSQNHLRTKNKVINEINQDLQTAAEIQEYFIMTEDSDEINSMKGIRRSFMYLPAKAIGGDFISTKNDNYGNICAIIADVEGKGISASLVTGVLKSAFSFLVQDCGNQPDILMSKLNNHLCNVLNRLYATCYYAYINITNNTVSFSKAGHPHPLFWRSKEEKFETIMIKGQLLGLNKDAEYNTKTYALDKGDKILFYTDGIIEERKDDAEMLGEEYLEKCFKRAIAQKPDSILDDIILKLNAYTQKDVYEDDITLLLYEFD
ncbi:MAG: SpoIIE family protein phosphatase [Spirochaetes bacterium]|nr:SpoIIE family protein phosphatase [Spirochaetota bacterium]